MYVVEEHELFRLVADRREPRLEELGIVVLRLEVDPKDGTAVALCPLREERRLAESGGCDECRDRSGRGAAEPVEKRSPNDSLPGRSRYAKESRRRRVRASQPFRDGHTISLQVRRRPV
jgi:hypothetical protein